MAAVDIDNVIKKGVEQALNEPILNGKSVLDWAEIGIHSQEQPQWISVKDRLPDAAGYECLVCAVNENYNQTHIFTAHTGYGEPGWWTGNVHYMNRVTSPSDNRLHPALNVTHWMPLPTPPEVNRDED